MKIVDLEKFIEVVNSITSLDYNYGEESNRYVSSFKEHKKNNGGKPAISSSPWATGGVTGGSCWDAGTGETPTVYLSRKSEPEEDFTNLDKVLELICPNISFLTYKNICDRVVKRKDWTLNEYYGNHTNYAEKYVYLEDLYNELKSLNLL